MLARLTGFAAAAGLSLALAGCFQPLHGTAFSNIRPTLASTSVAPIEGHIGHYMKAELDYILSGGTPPAEPQYRLTAKPSGAPSVVIVDTVTVSPQTMTYPVSANYTLVSLKDGKVVASGTAQATVSFDRDSQRYATLRAQRDAEIRAAKVLAEQIRTKIVGELARGR